MIRDESENAPAREDARPQEVLKRAVRGMADISVHLNILGRLAVFLLILHVVADVLMRFTLNQPLEGTLEYGRNWYMPAIALLGIPLAQQRDEHIAAPVIYDRLPSKLRKEFDGIAFAAMSAVLLTLGVSGLFGAIAAMRIGEGQYQMVLPIWPARFFVPLALCACALELLNQKLSPQAPSRVGPGLT